jgi:hypothetical protein
MDFLKTRIRKTTSLFRKLFQCNFGLHWRMKNDSGLLCDIAGAGTCSDCGYRKEAMVWPRSPTKKLKKTTL